MRRLPAGREVPRGGVGLGIRRIPTGRMRRDSAIDKRALRSSHVPGPRPFRGMRTTPLLVAFALVIGGLLGWALHRGSQPSAPATERRPAETVSAEELGRAVLRLEELSVRIGELVAELGARPSAPAHEREPLTAVPPATTSGADVLAGLQELQRSVDRLLAARGDTVERLQELRKERPEADWSALDPLVELCERDPERARKEVMLLSEEELLRRFGAPDQITTGPVGIKWIYGHEYVPDWDRYRRQIVFVLTEGVVRTLRVE